MSPNELSGRTIAILQTRHAQVMADLVTRRGGRPLTVPTLREEIVDDLAPLQAVLEEVARGPLDLAVFQTGVGVTRLFDLAGQLGLVDSLTGRLAAATVVVRGPKPLAVLLKRGIRIDRRAVEPYTTAQVLPLIDQDLAGSTALVQQHGAPNHVLVDFLVAGGAQVLEAFTYQWALPEDLEPVRSFLETLAQGGADATVFTSASQVENLFAIASQMGQADRLPGWLRERTLIVSIGPTTSATLREHDLEPGVEPIHPKMAPMVDALCAHYAERST